MAKPIGKNVGTVHITNGKDFRVVNTADFKANEGGEFDDFKPTAAKQLKELGVNNDGSAAEAPKKSSKKAD
jgi:hypothetical protein